MPQIDSKGAALVLAYMAGTMTGLADKSFLCVIAVPILIIFALWQYRLED